MLKKIINFIKYSNVFTIAAIVVFVVIATAVASNDDIKNRVLGEKIVTESGIDNSALLAADLENFDLEMKILDVKEDEDNYYLVYQFQTLGIRENIWQTVLRQKELEISKKALAGQDLGLYAAEELGEVIDYELAYLKEVQENENKKGDNRIVQETKYEGLLGLIISTKTKELPPEYELVVKPPVIEEIPPAPFDKGGDDGSTQENGTNGGDDQNSGEIDIPYDNSYYQKLKELCEENDLFWYDNVCNDEEEAVLICDSDNLNLCDTRELCEGVNSYWYNDICNVEAKTILVCDSDNLNLCDTKDLCDGIDLYWYNDICNDKEEVVIFDPVCDSDNLNLCDENNCETEGGFWYDGACNVEELTDEPAEEPAGEEVVEE